MAEGITMEGNKMAEVKVINGVNVLDADVAGKTVAEVRAMSKQALNIDDEAKAIVNGDEVKSTYVLEAGDELEFVKKSGTKG